MTGRWKQALLVLGASVLGGISGCTGCVHDLPHEEAVLSWIDLHELIQVDVERPFEVPDGVELAWLDRGLAGLSVTVNLSEGRAEEAQGMRIVRWDLPLPLAEAAGGGHAEPEIVGLPIPRVVEGLTPAPEQRAGFWVHRSELALIHRVGDPLPEELNLVYPVFAAHLAGTALAAGHSNADMYTVRRTRDGVMTECLAIPTGTTMRLPLLPVDRGTFRGAFSTLRLGEDPTAGPKVVVSLDGEVLFRGLLTLDGHPMEFEPPGADSFVVEPSAVTRAVDVAAKGKPGGLVFFENPMWTRERTYNDRPNVMLVLVDTLRADRLGAYGNENELTPNLDELAEDSILFEDCWSTSSWTLPSVASMLTSLHSEQHGASKNDRRLGEGVTTLAEAFRTQGYRCAAFTGGGFVSPNFGLDRGFHTFDSRGGGVQAVVDRARDFLDEAGEGPWFILLHTYEVHAPYEPPLAAKEKVLRRYPGALGDRTPEPQNFYEQARKGLRRDTVQCLSDLYDEEIRYTDAVLGEFFDELEERDLYDEMVLALTSDHGEEFAEHGLLGHGDTLYVEQLHVPLLLKWSDTVRFNEREPRAVSHIDLAPTILHLASFTDEELAATSFEGYPLYGFQPSRSENDPRNFIYATRDNADVDVLRMLREKNWVFIHGNYYYPGVRAAKTTPELYDMRGDPWQSRNVVQQRRAEKTQQQTKLKGFIQAIGGLRTENAEASLDARKQLELQKLGYN